MSKWISIRRREENAARKEILEETISFGMYRARKIILWCAQLNIKFYFFVLHDEAALVAVGLCEPNKFVVCVEREMSYMSESSETVLPMAWVRERVDFVLSWRNSTRFWGAGIISNLTQSCTVLSGWLVTLLTLFAFSLLPLRVTLECCHKVEIYDFLLDLLYQLCLLPTVPTTTPFCFLLSRFVHNLL